MNAGLEIKHPSQELITAVRAMLGKQGQKQLPYSLLYDDIGSALFEVITLLPEYGVTRAEMRLVRRYAHAIIDRLPYPIAVAELGSGTGKKTGWILESLRTRGPVTYYPIDISPSALNACARELEALAGVSVVKLNLSYLEGLEQVAKARKKREAILVLFLGSTIGNLEPSEADSLLLDTRGLLKKGDSLLLGTDLQKETSTLLAAYDDALGITAAFNLNLLAHLNRVLGADFDLRAFSHEARYDSEAHRIEMHLRSLKEQSATLPAADLCISFHAGETIWTESSYKYRPNDVIAMAEALGYQSQAQWIDEEWPFAVNLWTVP